MFFTDRMMLRNFDEAADLSSMLQWMNDETFLAALSSEPPKPCSRETVKTMVEKSAKNQDGLPFFVVCEKPPESQMPAQLSPNDDLFMLDGKARYPMIGVLNLRTHAFSFTNRVIGFGIALDKAHQGDHSPVHIR